MKKDQPVFEKKDDETFHLKKEFIDDIINKIPVEYNDLEKTIYVYYILCYILTYDNNYYIKHGTEENRMRKNMFNISNENNEIVCFQFASAFKDILDSLGIQTSNLVYNFKNDDEFFDTHQGLKILVDGLVLDSDPTRKGADADDLAFVKIGKIGSGIRCDMLQSNLQEEFLQAKKKVSERIINDLNISYYKEIEDDLRAFKNVYVDELCEDKSIMLIFIFYEIGKLNLSRIDSLALFNQLFNSSFTSDERKYIGFKIITTETEWSVTVKCENYNIYYNFDTKEMPYYFKRDNKKSK